MNLVIVESPTKARTLKRFLGDDYTIEASMGHVRDLPKSKLGVNLDDNFEPEYETAKGKGKVITKLKAKAKEAKTIYLAMDPDREGEAIAWHVAHLLTGKKTKKSGAGPNFQRVTFHEITQSAIKEAIDHPHQLNLSLVDAQQARRVLDRLVGYNLSPVLWKKVRRGLSAGRVQSVALRLIVEREKEIEAFKPQEYWEVLVKLDTGKSTLPASSEAFDQLGDGQFIAGLYEINGSKLEIKGRVKDKQGLIYLTEEKEAQPVTADLKSATYAIESVDKTERKRSPYPPYITSTLQQAAANTLGWSGKQTMRIAQELYEKGLITYHRTDSTSLSTQAIEAARNLVRSRYGTEYLPEKPRLYKTKSKSAQEAHEAIRPTDALKDTLTDGESGLTARHQKLYRLIWQRLISSQMKDAIYDQTSITVLAKGKGEYRLRSSGSIVKFVGWRVIYNGKGDSTETILPPVEPEQNLSFVDLKSDQKFTQHRPATMTLLWSKNWKSEVSAGPVPTLRLSRLSKTGAMSSVTSAVSNLPLSAPPSPNS
jgi:DNA topoisomerase I